MKEALGTADFEGAHGGGEEGVVHTKKYGFLSGLFSKLNNVGSHC